MNDIAKEVEGTNSFQDSVKHYREAFLSGIPSANHVASFPHEKVLQTCVEA